MGRNEAGESHSVPAAKPSQVLRVGPPPKGRVIDPLFAVLGVLVLLSAVVLGAILPVVEVLPNQFRVSFVEEQTPLPGQTAFIDRTTAPPEAAFDLEVPVDRVTEVRIVFNLSDDIPSSEPDSFSVKLFSPDNNQVDTTFEVTTPRGEAVGAVGGAATEYQATSALVARTITVNARPQDNVTETFDLTLDEKAIAERILANERRPTTGTWRLLIRLTSIGDCPAAADPNSYVPPVPDPSDPTNITRPPIPDPVHLNRVAICRQATAQATEPGTDGGNPFTIESITVVSFGVVAERLG